MAQPSPIPTLIVTGWLGAGKTTLVKHLLDTKQLGRHRLAVNKCDLVDPSRLNQVERRVREINKEAAIIRVSHGRVPWRQLQNTGRSGRLLKREATASPPKDVVSVSLVSDQPLDRVALYNQLDRWRNHVLRAKGIVCFGDACALVELAGGRLVSRPGSSFAFRDQATTKFVVIAQGLDEMEVRQSLQACVRAPA